MIGTNANGIAARVPGTQARDESSASRASANHLVGADPTRCTCSGLVNRRGLQQDKELGCRQARDAEH
jgi:hypothetical protein